MPSLDYLGNSPLGYNKAYHLLRRASYRIKKEDIDLFSGLTANEALTRLFDYTPHIADLGEPLDFDGQNLAALSSGSRRIYRHLLIKQWFLSNAVMTTSLRFKLCFFLHSIWTSEFFGSQSCPFDYLKLLFYSSKGSYRDLAKKISKDNLMLQYLDNRFNSKTNPNENYAREFLELFTITKGTQVSSGDYTTYTEYDVQVAAKVLTGFRTDFKTGDYGTASGNTIDPDTGIPSGKNVYTLHDTNDKTFSPRFNNKTIRGAVSALDMDRELSDFIDMVFDQPIQGYLNYSSTVTAVAIALSEKLYRFFVHREITPEIKNDIIIPLAIYIYQNNYNIEMAVKKLLTSKHFYDEDNTIGEQNINGLVKSPLDFFLQTTSLFNIKYTTNPQNEQERRFNFNYLIRFGYSRFMQAIGFALFFPKNVASYPEMSQGPNYDKDWVTTNTLINRQHLSDSLISGKDKVQNSNININAQFNSFDFLEETGYFDDILTQLYNDPINNAATGMLLLMRKIEKIAFSHPLSNERFNELYQGHLLGNLSEINWAMEWKKYKNGGSGQDIDRSMKNLFRAILHSIEYQIF